MIIWSRWGILAFPFIGIGIAIGLGLKALLLPADTANDADGVFVGVGMLLAAVLLLIAVKLLVGKVIDKPQPAYFSERLPAPEKTEHGTTRTHRQVALRHPETGQQIYTNPQSTLFFIPLRFVPFAIAGLGVVIIIGSMVGLMSGS